MVTGKNPNTVKNLVANGKLRQALAMLSMAIEQDTPSLHKDALALACYLSDINRGVASGRLSTSKEFKYRNRIAYRILVLEEEYNYLVQMVNDSKSGS